MNGRPKPSIASPPGLTRALRLVVVTDSHLAAPVEKIVQEALQGGALTVQLRAKACSSGELLELARRIVTQTRDAGALLIVNDRVDVALVAGADGVHLGPQDLPVAAVRAVVPKGFVIGYSTDDPVEAQVAEMQGADYIGCGAVWVTHTKEVGDEAIGIDRLQLVCRSVGIPVVAIGGVTSERAREIARSDAAGVAVVKAVNSSADPRGAVKDLWGALGR